MTLPEGYWLPNGLARHGANRPGALIETETVIDVGAGVRPMQWFRPKKHICIEPFGPYCERLRGAGGYVVVEKSAYAGLKGRKADSVMLLDFLHHVDRDYGEKVLSRCLDVATRQIVVREPSTFEADAADVWGMGGEHYQTHRSFWPITDFSGWMTERTGRGYFAVLNL